MSTRTPVNSAARQASGEQKIDTKAMLRVLAAVQRGDFSARMPGEWSGSYGRLATALNELIESNQRLEREIRRLSRLALTSRYKSEFLANMSHELRTPLSSLLILAQELAANPDGNLLPKQIEYATIIRSSGTDLLKLINDILDLSKIESGTVALDISSWPIDGLKPMLDRTFRHVAEATKLAFSIDLRPGLPETIPTDPQRLQQILNNLLSNAFKFTERGKIEFVAEMVTSGWSPSNEILSRASQVISFRVIDTGIGIPLAKQQSIFEAFAQADGSTSRKYGGTGLGLSICRELTRLLGGEIRIQSEPGVGSVFTVFLPLIAPAQRRSTPEEIDAREQAGSNDADPASSALAGKKVLVVDDDIRDIFALTAMLERQKMEVVSVNSGQEAVTLLQQQHEVDVALVDVMMPEMDGYATMSKMRELKHFAKRPIIALTAKALKGDREKCIEAGASDYIAKPVNNAHLLSMLKSWLVQ